MEIHWVAISIMSRVQTLSFNPYSTRQTVLASTANTAHWIRKPKEFTQNPQVVTARIWTGLSAHLWNLVFLHGVYPPSTLPWTGKPETQTLKFSPQSRWMETCICEGFLYDSARVKTGRFDLPVCPHVLAFNEWGRGDGSVSKVLVLQLGWSEFHTQNP